MRNNPLAILSADGLTITCRACLNKKGATNGTLKTRHAYTAGVFVDHKKGKKHGQYVTNIEAEKEVQERKKLKNPELKNKRQAGMANFFPKKPKKDEDNMSDDNDEDATEGRVDVDLMDTGYVFIYSVSTTSNSKSITDSSLHLLLQTLNMCRSI